MKKGDGNQKPENGNQKPETGNWKLENEENTIPAGMHHWLAWRFVCCTRRNLSEPFLTTTNEKHAIGIGSLPVRNG